MSTEATPTAATTSSGSTTAATSPTQNTGGGATAPSSQSAADWTTGLTDDLRGFVQNKGFKDPGMALESYRNLEKLVGMPKERLLKLPENMDDPAALSEIYQRLGRPEKPDGYKIEVPKGGDPEFAKAAGSMFHEAGLTTKQAQTLLAKWNAYTSGSQEAVIQAQNQKVEAEAKELQKEWGRAFEDQTKSARHAMAEFGLSVEDIDGMESTLGHKKTMKLLADIGSKLGEGSFHRGGQNSSESNLTPAAAQNQIAALQQDKDFMGKYLTGDGPSKSRMDRLFQQAYPT